MKTTLHIRHSHYLYEFYFRGPTIVRIIRSSVDRNVESSEVFWDDLDEEVKEMAEEETKDWSLK